LSIAFSSAVAFPCPFLCHHMPFKHLRGAFFFYAHNAA
jgi:hypothetical protein